MGEWEEERERNVFHFGCNVLKLQLSSTKSENVLGSVQPRASPVAEAARGWTHGRAELCLIFVASFKNSCYNVGTRYPQRKR